MDFEQMLQRFWEQDVWKQNHWQHVTSCRSPHTALLQGVWQRCATRSSPWVLSCVLHTGLRGMTSSTSCLHLGAQMCC